MMKTVLFLDFLVVTTVIFCALKFGEAIVNTDQHGGHASDSYTPRLTREFLLAQRSVAQKFPPVFDFLPEEMKPTDNKNIDPFKRKRGRRGGVRRRLRRQRTLLPLPSIIYANTRSIRPKLPHPNFFELCANATFLREYRDACIMCFSETWFSSEITDDSLHIDGFGTPFRGDRAGYDTTGKHWGGGVCIYVNERYCNRANITVRKTLSTPDVDLISVSLRPKYLPREFGQIFMTVVYSHPSADNKRAAKEITDVIRALQLIAPDAPNFIIGDFNKGLDMKKSLPDLRQYITCNTRKNSRPDGFYGNIPNAYQSYLLPNIGQSDHHTVHLIPSYKPVIQTQPIVKKTVKVYSHEKLDELRACFECTDWNVFIDSADSLDNATDVISDYISFCENSIIPTKKVKIFPNNKPYISKSLKHTINQNKISFQTGDTIEQKRVQIILTSEIREAKKEYTDRVEKKFEGVVTIGRRGRD